MGYLVMVASSSNWKLYADGSIIGEKNNYFGNQNDPVKGFGNYVNTGAASPQGAIDDIRIYNRALSILRWQHSMNEKPKVN